MDEKREIFLSDRPRSALKAPLRRPKSAPPRCERRGGGDDVKKLKTLNGAVKVSLPPTTPVVGVISRVVLNSAPSYRMMEHSKYLRLRMVRH